MNTERVKIRAEVREVFNKSRRSARSRSIVIKLFEKRVNIGRFNVCSLMKEAGLISKQPGSCHYKTARKETVAP